VLKKRFTENKVSRDVLQVMSFGKSEVPNVVFSHEVGIVTAAGSVQNDLRWGNEKGKVTLSITPGTAKGLDEASYKEATATSWEPVLLPWGPVESQLWTWKGASFDKTSEKRKAGAPPRPPAGGSPAVVRPPTPPPPPPGADLPKVYELYKKERGVSGSPRFDLQADVAGDARGERALLHDKDLVVFGAGYKNGKGYAYSTLPFAATDDIKNVLSRDATGDGKYDLIVRGIVKGRASGDAGGGEVERTIELVYQVGPDTIKRVFGAEVGRAMGGKSVTGTIGFKVEGKKGIIVLAPGKATGWTQATYPFPQDTAPVNNLEPLLLPWGGQKAVTYTWNGTAFAR
jgi:hypothetical protein